MIDEIEWVPISNIICINLPKKSGYKDTLSIANDFLMNCLECFYQSTKLHTLCLLCWLSEVFNEANLCILFGKFMRHILVRILDCYSTSLQGKEQPQRVALNIIQTKELVELVWYYDKIPDFRCFWYPF